MTTTTSQALATRDDSPKALVKQYEQSFMDVLPSHVRPETWVRIAQGALKKGPRDQNGLTALERAASGNVGVFLATLLDAARLGLEPGTEQYYLTPRKVKGGGSEILGIIGYQGHIELMYRAGAISSVVAENVYSRDEFLWSPGSLDTERIADGRPPRWEGPQKVPFHQIDWDAEDRGQLRLTYAYALMTTGAVSKVVVLNRHDINRIKKSSQGADGQYSPWQQHEPAMWLKSSVRQLAKWVPTSAEYRNAIATQAPAALTPVPTVEPGLGAPELPADLPDVSEDITDPIDLEDHGTDDDVVDAVIVDDDHDDEPPAPRMRPVPPEPVSDEDTDDRMTEPQRKALHALLRQRGGVGDTRFPILSELLDRPITSTNELTVTDASFCIDALQADSGGAPEGDAA